MTSKQAYQIIVIGGGPAGLMAAGQAAHAGMSTLLLEKMEQPGSKLQITGKGRCNLTNIVSQEEFITHFGRNGQFLRQAFAKFFNQELLDLMAGIGVKTLTERGGRVFPANNDAKEITKKIIKWATDQGAEIQTDTAIRQIELEGQHVIGVITHNDQFISGQAVILATGGASFSHTGSSGDGYQMAAAAGHTITPIRPALVPLKTRGDICQRLQGLTLRNVEVHVFLDGKESFNGFGELLFTHFGISGPIILSMSGKIVDALQTKQRVDVTIDLKPALDEKKLDTRLLRDMDAHGKQYFHNLLGGLLPQKLVPVMAELCQIPLDKPCHQVTSEERNRLIQHLKHFEIEISGYLALDYAMVTAGGVSLKEIDPRTMESKIIDGLYFAGEVMDLAADTGGYNLQAAFSTGWLAGNSAAQQVSSRQN